MYLYRASHACVGVQISMCKQTGIVGPSGTKQLNVPEYERTVPILRFLDECVRLHHYMRRSRKGLAANP